MVTTKQRFLDAPPVEVLDRVVEVLVPALVLDPTVTMVKALEVPLFDV